MPRIVIEEDHFLKIVPVVLDPATPVAHQRAVAEFFAHDEPDFPGWCRRLQQRLPALQVHQDVLEGCVRHGEGELDNSIVINEIRRRRGC